MKSLTAPSFGFVSEEIGALKIGGSAFPLTAGKDTIDFSATGDVTVREVA